MESSFIFRNTLSKLLKRAVLMLIVPGANAKYKTRLKHFPVMMIALVCIEVAIRGQEQQSGLWTSMISAYTRSLEQTSCFLLSKSGGKKCYISRQLQFHEFTISEFHRGAEIEKAKKYSNLWGSHGTNINLIHGHVNLPKNM